MNNHEFYVTVDEKLNETLQRVNCMEFNSMKMKFHSEIKENQS